MGVTLQALLLLHEVVVSSGTKDGILGAASQVSIPRSWHPTAKEAELPNCLSFDACVKNSGDVSQCNRIHLKGSTQSAGICVKAACILRTEFCRHQNGQSRDKYCELCYQLAHQEQVGKARSQPFKNFVPPQFPKIPSGPSATGLAPPLQEGPAKHRSPQQRRMDAIDAKRKAEASLPSKSEGQRKAEALFPNSGKEDTAAKFAKVKAAMQSHGEHARQALHSVGEHTSRSSKMHMDRLSKHLEAAKQGETQWPRMKLPQMKFPSPLWGKMKPKSEM